MCQSRVRCSRASIWQAALLSFNDIADSCPADGGDSGPPAAGIQGLGVPDAPADSELGQKPMPGIEAAPNADAKGEGGSGGGGAEAYRRRWQLRVGVARGPLVAGSLDAK
jgi:hypothetical protein